MHEKFRVIESQIRDSVALQVLYFKGHLSLLRYIFHLCADNEI